MILLDVIVCVPLQVARASSGDNTNKSDSVLDQSAREQEALLLREKIDHCFKANPAVNLVVLGDFNDTRDSLSVRSLMGRGRAALIDTRPAERNGDDRPNPNPRYAPRNITWTYHYGKEDTYSRIDYIFVARGLLPEVTRESATVYRSPLWEVASDHRPVFVTIVPVERNR